VSGQDQDEQFARRVGAALEDSTSALDARTLSRLTRARQAALARASGTGGRGWLRGWQALWPAGALGAALLALLLFVGQPLPPAALQASNVHGEDLELLADRDALALAQDEDGPEGEPDYAFYDWAVDAAQAPGAVGS
jgi:hypothetical protein